MYDNTTISDGTIEMMITEFETGQRQNFQQQFEHEQLSEVLPHYHKLQGGIAMKRAV